MSQRPPMQVTGYVEGEFDCGYLISARVGDEWLSGVLYHLADPVPAPTPPLALLPQPVVQQQGHQIKGHPKKIRHAYNFFVSEKYAEKKSHYHKMEREFMTMTGRIWKNMSKAEKAVYEKKSAKNKVRYERELAEYEQGLKADVAVQHANAMGKELGDRL